MQIRKWQVVCVNVSEWNDLKPQGSFKKAQKNIWFENNVWFCQDLGKSMHFWLEILQIRKEFARNSPKTISFSTFAPSSNIGSVWLWKYKEHGSFHQIRYIYVQFLAAICCTCAMSANDMQENQRVRFRVILVPGIFHAIYFSDPIISWPPERSSWYKDWNVSARANIAALSDYRADFALGVKITEIPIFDCKLCFESQYLISIRIWLTCWLAQFL